ncbi:hypothetical protein TNCV_94181, partial [Trichonephila clavipes]
YSRASGDGQHHFEPWSSDEDDTELAPPPLTTTTHQREDVSPLNRFHGDLLPTVQLFSLRLPKPHFKGVSMPPHHGAQNRSGGEAHLGLLRAPPHLFWVSRGDLFIRVLKKLFGLRAPQ